MPTEDDAMLHNALASVFASITSVRRFSACRISPQRTRHEAAQGAGELGITVTQARHIQLSTAVKYPDTYDTQIACVVTGRLHLTGHMCSTSK